MIAGRCMVEWTERTENGTIASATLAVDRRTTVMAN